MATVNTREMYGNQEKRNLKSGKLIRTITLVTMMFFFIYPFSLFPNVPELTTNRIASLVILVWGIFSQGRVLKIKISKAPSEKAFIRYLLYSGFLLLYTSVVLLVWGAGTGETVTNIYINILTFSVAFYYGAKFVFNDTDELMRVILWASVVQSFIIIFGLINPGVYSWIRETFYATSYYELTGKLGTMRGYAIGIGCITSKGSQKLSIGLIACVYFMMKQNRNYKYLIYLFIIVFASAAVSRTGALFGLIALAYLLVVFFKRAPKRAQSLTLKVVGSVMIGVLLVLALNMGNKLYEVFWRLISLLESGVKPFFDSYFSSEATIIPGVCFETLIGTGIWSGTSGCGLTINADGGFFRTYFAIGLIGSVIYYLFMANNFRKGMINISGYLKSVCYLFLIFILLGEFKEPLLFDWYYQTIFFLFMLTAERKSEEIMDCYSKTVTVLQ